MPNRDEVEEFLYSIYRYLDEDGNSVSNLQRLAKLLPHPLMTFAALRYLRTFPIVRVATPRTAPHASGRLLRARRPWRHYGYISSLIELPTPYLSYWHGTPKQNLRTRTRHARDAGFEVKAVIPSEIDDVISQVLRDKGWASHEVESDLRERDLRRHRESLLCVAVVDSSEHAVAFCVGSQTGDVVRTLWSVTSEKGAVRWLCFSGYVEEVGAKGARFIVEDAPWAFIGGNKIFAGHLGFVPARIRSI